MGSCGSAVALLDQTAALGSAQIAEDCAGVFDRTCVSVVVGDPQLLALVQHRSVQLPAVPVVVEHARAVAGIAAKACTNECESEAPPAYNNECVYEQSMKQTLATESPASYTALSLLHSPPDPELSGPEPSPKWLDISPSTVDDVDAAVRTRLGALPWLARPALEPADCRFIVQLVRGSLNGAEPGLLSVGSHYHKASVLSLSWFLKDKGIKPHMNSLALRIVRQIHPCPRTSRCLINRAVRLQVGRFWVSFASEWLFGAAHCCLRVALVIFFTLC